MSYNNSSNILGQPSVPIQITIADWRKFLGYDTASFPVVPPMPTIGQFMYAADPIYGECIFMLGFGLAGLQVGELVAFRNNYSVVRAAAGVRGVSGIAMSANTDPTAMSWYCVQGAVPARVTSGAANLPLYNSATAGSPSTTVVLGDQHTGAMSLTAVSAVIGTKIVNTVNGSAIVGVPNLDGLYIGMGISGTGIPAAATIVAIGFGGLMLGAQGPQALQVQISANATATGGPVATFAHSATFLTAFMQFPTAAGLG